MYIRDKFKRLSFCVVICVCAFALSNCKSKEQPTTRNWCEQEIRSEFNNYKEVSTSSGWFKVYDVGEGVLAIAEPYNYQEVISYLIFGDDKALLFDTGMGLDSMSLLASELTDKPVIVLNSHTHYDHIGSNHEFETILAVDTLYTRKWAKEGWSHDLVKHEVAEDAFCSHHLPNRDVSDYNILPFTISEFIKNGSKIDLGNRIVEVISVPGHTPDAIALIDKENGYIWTGDTFYEATIWLFFEGTDLDAYMQSVTKLEALAPELTKVFPAHNTPVVQPERLIELKKAFTDIISGEKKARSKVDNAHPEDGDALTFEFEHFSFLVNKKQLKKSRELFN